MAGQIGGWAVEVFGVNAEESPYVAMTRELCRVFPKNGGTFAIEPDASSGSYFWAADYLQGLDGRRKERVTVSQWPRSGWQVDADFPKFVPLPAELSRLRHLGDAIMTAIVIAPFAERSTRFTDLGRLRLQECERVKAMRTELARCGVKVIEEGDTLQVWPAEVKPAEIETYDDHRMAMCFSILGLKVAGMKIKNPGCVRKTFPNFFQKLATPPPAGLGMGVLDSAKGEALAVDDLLAE
jgi:3-phosphoshikimate 1-carboxyvinyltransferase